MTQAHIYDINKNYGLDDFPACRGMVMAAETLTKKENAMNDVLKVMIAVLVVVASVALVLLAISSSGPGDAIWAERKILIGQTYECLTEPFEKDGVWYAIVEHENSKLLFCRFEERPPKNGLAAKLGGKNVFLPLNEPVTIKNPLVEQEATADK